MLSPYRLCPVVFGTAALVAVVHTQPSYATLSHAQVHEIARQVTVQIEGQAPGSGVIIAQQGQTYYVLTAEHVVASADEYDIITPDGKKHPLDYKTVKKLPGLDLAVLSFTSHQNYRVVEIGDSSKLKEDEPIFVSGFPFLGRKINQTGYQFNGGNLLAQASRPLYNGYALAYFNYTYTGMSGGAILNQQGQLIGIHGATKTDRPQTQGFNEIDFKEGLNLGIPINTFLYSVPQVVPTLQLPTLPLAAPTTQVTAADLLIRALEQKQKQEQQAFMTINQAIRLRPNYAAAYFVRGMMRGHGDRQGAISDYTEAIRLNPQFVNAFFSRGIVRANLGDDQGAIKDYDEAIRLDPQNAFALYGRGNLRQHTGDLQGAIADFTEVVQINPSNVLGRLALSNRASLRADLGDRQGVILDYTQLIRIDPSHFPAFRGRAKARAALGDLQGAIADYTEVIRLIEPNSATFNDRGNLRRQVGDRQGALSDFNEAIRLNPRFAQAFSNRGNVRDDLGDEQGALSDFNEAIRLNPQDYQAFNNRGVVREKLGDKQAAIKDYTEAIRLNPQFVQAFSNRGNARRRSGDRQGAITDLQQVVDLARAQGNQLFLERATRELRRAAGQSASDLLDAQTFNNRGNTRRQSGDRQGAISDFTEAIRLNPQLAQAFNNRGLTREDLGDKQGAITDYRQAVDLARIQGNSQMLEMATQHLKRVEGEPASNSNQTTTNPQDAAIAFFDRAILRRRAGDRQGTISNLTEAIRLNPQYALAFFERASTRERIGDKQGAITDYTEVIRLDPQLAAAFFNRGYILKELGDKQGAIADFQRAADLSRAQGKQQMYESATQQLRGLQ
jgi:tetratricopeptide (TPR) repeat protein